MPPEEDHVGFHLEPTRQARFLPALLAVVVSLGLHGVAYRFLPALPLGKPPEVEFVPAPHTVHMHEVRPAVDPEVAEEERMRMSRPEIQDEIMEVLETWTGKAPPEAASQKVETRVPLGGEKGPSAEPDLPDTAHTWEPRQDILMIEEQIFEEEVSALPRTLTPSIPRQNTPLDVTRPAELPPDALERARRHSADLPVGPGEVPGLDLGSLEGLLTAPAATALPDLPETADQAMADVIAEPQEVVQALEPVEDLLGITLYRFADPDDPGALFFKVKIFRQGIEALPVLPKDIVLIQDCSESMTSAKLEECKRGLLLWLDMINPNDRFNVMSFRDRVDFCFNQLTPLTAVAKARARYYIRSMKSRGKTDVNKSLEKVLEQPFTSERPVIALLVTDGRPTMGLVDSSDIIESFTRNNLGKVSMFAVGGGRRANKYLLDLIGYRNRGDAMVVEQRNGIPPALMAIGKQLRRPVLSDLRYQFTGMSNSEIYPETLTHLYLDRPLVLYGRAPRDAEDIAFRIVGSSVGKEHDMIFKIDWSTAQPGSDDLRHQWASHKMYHLIGQYTATRNPAELEEIRELAARYGLEVPYVKDLKAPVRY